MPLHLLGKKSWNVYNAANIEKVRRDEAEAQAKEEAEEQRQQHEDTSRRIALLRGEQVPPEIESDQATDSRARHTGDDLYLSQPTQQPRKRRRLYGEDETDAEIRHAREAANLVDQASTTVRVRRDDADLIDRAGHIQLISKSTTDDKHDATIRRDGVNNSSQNLRTRTASDLVQPSSHDTFGKQPANQTPWYSSRPSESAEVSHTSLDTVKNVNAWGRPDDRRAEREQNRITSNDPLAFMQRAQTKLKQNESFKQKQAQKQAERDARHRAHSQERYARRYRDEEHRSRRRRSKERTDRTRHQDHNDDRHRSSTHQRCERFHGHHHSHRHRHRSRSPDLQR